MFDLKALLEKCHKMVKDIVVLLHGRRIPSLFKAQFVLSNKKYRCELYDATSAEYVPAEVAFIEKTKEFKAIGQKS